MATYVLIKSGIGIKLVALSPWLNAVLSFHLGSPDDVEVVNLDAIQWQLPHHLCRFEHVLTTLTWQA